eukprot:13904227-Alexandrium_andersonii.AAC.1
MIVLRTYASHTCWAHSSEFHVLSIAIQDSRNHVARTQLEKQTSRGPHTRRTRSFQWPNK